MKNEGSEHEATKLHHPAAKKLAMPEMRPSTDIVPPPLFPDLGTCGSSASELRHQYPSFRRLSGLVPIQRGGSRRSLPRLEAVEFGGQADSVTATPLTRHNSFLVHGSRTRRRSALAPRTTGDEDTDDPQVAILCRSYSHALITSAVLMSSRASSANAQNPHAWQPIDTLIPAYHAPTPPRGQLPPQPSTLPYSPPPPPRSRQLSLPTPSSAATPAAAAASVTAAMAPAVNSGIMATLLHPAHPFVETCVGGRPLTAPGGGGDSQPCRTVVHSVRSTAHRSVSNTVTPPVQPTPVHIASVQQSLIAPAAARSGLVTCDTRAAGSIDRDDHGISSNGYGPLATSVHVSNRRGSSGGSFRSPTTGRDITPILCPSSLSRLPTPPRHTINNINLTSAPPPLHSLAPPMSAPPARMSSAPFAHAKSCGFHPTSFRGPYMTAFHLAWTSLCLAFFSNFAPAAMLPVVAEDLGLSKPVVAAAGATSLVSSIITRLFMGAAVRRYGPRYCQALILLLTATPLACMALVNSAGGFIAARFVISACLGTFVISNFWVILMFHPLVLGAAAATCTSWGNAGSGLPMIMMPLLYELMKNLYDGDIRSAWKAVFYIPAGIHLLLACITLLLGQDTPQGDLMDWEAHEERQNDTSWDPNTSTHKRQQQRQQQKRQQKQNLQHNQQVQLQQQQLLLTIHHQRMAQEQQHLQQREVRMDASGSYRGGGSTGRQNSGSGSARQQLISSGQSRCSPQLLMYPQPLSQQHQQHQQRPIGGLEEAAVAGWQGNLQRIRTGSTSLRGWARQRGSSGGPARIACRDSRAPEDSGLSCEPVEGSSVELWHAAERPAGPHIGMGMGPMGRSSRKMLGTESLGGWSKGWGSRHSPVGFRQASLPVAEGVESGEDPRSQRPVDRGCGVVVVEERSDGAGLDLETTAQWTRYGDGGGDCARAVAGAGAGGERPTGPAAMAAPATAPREGPYSSVGAVHAASHVPSPSPSPALTTAQPSSTRRPTLPAPAPATFPPPPFPPAFCPRAALISSFATTRPSPSPPLLRRPPPLVTAHTAEWTSLGTGSRCGDSVPGDPYTEWLRRRVRQHSTLGAGWREAIRLYGLVLRNSRCMLLSLNYGYNFGAQMALYNILTLYLVRQYGMGFIAGGGLAAMPGLLNMWSRVSGSLLSNWMCRRFGMRGRLWLLWMSQCAGGACCLLMGFTGSGPSGLAATSVLLLLFALATQIAAGTTFTITPYVSYRAFSAVLGIVSAGGQLGGALLLAFFAPNSLTYQQGLRWMGVSILVVSTSLAFVHFPMWGSMLTGPDARQGGVQEEHYYLAEWTPEEQDAGIAAPALMFATLARSERSGWNYGVEEQPLGRL